MRKYLYSFTLSLLTFFAFCACSNVDIEISRHVVVNVAPHSVIENIRYEVNANDIQNLSLSNGYKLRTRLLFYNSEGNQVVFDNTSVQYLDSYDKEMRVSGLPIADGDYTIIAITDVVLLDNSGRVTDEYWTMKGESNISTLKIDYVKKDNNNGFVHSRGILGIGKQKVTIPYAGQEITVRPTMAGSLVVFYYKGIHSFNDISQYGMLTDWIPGNVTFDRDGDFHATAEHPANTVSTLEYGYVDLFKPTGVAYADAPDVATYYFTFPSAGGTNNFRFVYNSTAKAPMSQPLVTGGEYEFRIDLTSANVIKDITTSFTKKN